MTLRPVQFGIQFYDGPDKSFIADLAQNCYLEQNPQTAKVPVSAVGTPGLKLFATVGPGPIRGMHEALGYTWIVSGTELHRLSDNGTSTQIDGVIAGTGSVRMTSNLTHIAIAARRYAYYADSSGIKPLPEEYLNGAAFQDGYGLFTQANTENWFISPVDDLTTINAVDVTQADAFTDKVVGIISDHREVWVFGRLTIEVFVNTGNSAFPFQRTGAGFIEHGCAGAGSIAKDENSVYWLGEDLRVYRAQGYSPQRISNTGIERYIESRLSPDTVESFVYRQAGHTHYVMNFSDGTIVFDATTGLWHTRKTLNQDRWRANHYAHTDSNRHLVGDFENGKIYELKTDWYLDETTRIQRRVQSMMPHAANTITIMDELVADTPSGPPGLWTLETLGTTSFRTNGWATAPSVGDILTVDDNDGESIVPATLVVESVTGPLSIVVVSIVNPGLYIEPPSAIASLTDESGVSEDVPSVDWSDASTVFTHIDPQLMMDYSDDGGKTYSAEHWRSMGQPGQRNRIPRWFSMGAYRTRLLRLTCSDPIPFTLGGLYSRYEHQQQ